MDRFMVFLNELYTAWKNAKIHLIFFWKLSLQNESMGSNAEINPQIKIMWT